MAEFPAAPTPPQPGDDSETFSTRAADSLNYLMACMPLVEAMQPATDAFETLVGYMGYAGAWSGLTGALAVPAATYHDDALWLLLDDLADVTAVEPGTDATKWITLPRTSKRTAYRSVVTTLANMDLPLEAGWDWFKLRIETIQHDAAATRALMVAFTTGDITDPPADIVYGEPVIVSDFVDNATDLNLDLTFDRSTTSPRSMRSSHLGELGHIVPAGATAIRIGFGTAGAFDGNMEDGSVAGVVTLIAHRGNAV